MTRQRGPVGCVEKVNSLTSFPTLKKFITAQWSLEREADKFPKKMFYAKVPRDFSKERKELHTRLPVVENVDSHDKMVSRRIVAVRWGTCRMLRV